MARPATTPQGRGREQWPGRPRGPDQRPLRKAGGGGSGQGSQGGRGRHRGAGPGGRAATAAQGRAQGAAPSAGGGCDRTMRPLRQRPQGWRGQRSTERRGQQRRQPASVGRVGVEASAGERGGGDGDVEIDPPQWCQGVIKRAPLRQVSGPLGGQTSGPYGGGSCPSGPSLPGSGGFPKCPIGARFLSYSDCTQHQTKRGRRGRLS